MAALTAAQAAAGEPASAKLPVVYAEPARIVNGSACVFWVRQPGTLRSLTAAWMGHKVFFAFDPGRKAWFGLAGVGVETKAGRYPLIVEGETSQGTPVKLSAQVAVGHIKYPSIALKVPERFTAPDPEILARVEKEREVKDRVFATISPERQWTSGFTVPVPSTASDGFGTQRKFNGVLKSTHHGLDYHAHTGTPVSSIATGKVLLARELFGEGGCVIIDHGQGLLTLYMHLSEFKAKEGDAVTRGQLIALSGASGRATGPHLHLGVRWQGVYVDPRTLFKLRLPS
ncbi:MAG TPA: M23 family metallopeptidase [Candidatus Saccharimonadales bacterium]|nr:M23 family metallopeptidase [Candidatus Saccharimonadales bacterium]